MRNQAENQEKAHMRTVQKNAKKEAIAKIPQKNNCK